MQQDKQPDYHPVVFRDRAAGYAFLTRSTATSERTIDWDDGERDKNKTYTDERVTFFGKPDCNANGTTYSLSGQREDKDIYTCGSFTLNARSVRIEGAKCVG